MEGGALFAVAARRVVAAVALQLALLVVDAARGVAVALAAAADGQIGNGVVESVAGRIREAALGARGLCGC